MKNNKTLILLVLAGLGVWWYMRKKNETVETKNTVKENTPVAPDTSSVIIQKFESDYKVNFQINGFKKRVGNVPNTI